MWFGKCCERLVVPFWQAYDKCIVIHIIIAVDFCVATIGAFLSQILAVMFNQTLAAVASPNIDKNSLLHTAS